MADLTHDEASTVGPRCGNNPNARLTPGNWQAMDEPGRAWMRGELPSADYFAMARQSARRDVAPGRRLRAGLGRVLRCLGSPYASREGKR